MAGKNKLRTRSSSGRGGNKTEKVIPSLKEYVSNRSELIKIGYDHSFCFLLLLRFGFFLFLYWFWAFRLGPFLYMAQYNDLFLWNVSCFQEHIVRITGPLLYLTSFIVQFFYYPLAGGFLVAIALSLIEWLTGQYFHLKGWYSIFSFLPPLLLSVGITQINYYLFSAFNIAFLFSIIPGCLFALLFAFYVNKISSPKKRLWSIVSGTLFFYPLCGFFSLFGTLLALLHEGTFSNDSRRNFRMEFMFLVLLLVPLFWYLFYYNQISFSKLYYIGLMEEGTVDKDYVTQFFFYFCYWGTFVCLLLTSLVQYVCYRFFFHEQKSVIQREKRFRFGWRETILLVIVLLFCGGAVHYSFFPKNYSTLLKIGRLLDEHRWKEIIEVEESIADPINPLISARYLALVQLKQVGDRLFECPVKPSVSIPLKAVTSLKMLGDRIVYEHGQINMAIRAAMNNYVDRNGHSAWSIKTMALGALANNENELARRYLNILASTLFYRRWARQYLCCIERVEDTDLQEILQKTDPAIYEVQEKRCDQDYICKVTVVDYIVKEHYSHYDSKTRSREEVITQLMNLLIASDMPRFMEIFDIFISRYEHETLPRYLQEAILLYYHYFEKNDLKVEQYRVSPIIKNRFKGFVESFDRLSIPYSEEQVKLLHHKFGDTVWFHLAFVKELDIY